MFWAGTKNTSKTDIPFHLMSNTKYCVFLFDGEAISLFKFQIYHHQHNRDQKVEENSKKKGSQANILPHEIIKIHRYTTFLLIPVVIIFIYLHFLCLGFDVRRQRINEVYF